METLMRVRIILTIATMLLGVLVLSGVALAVTRTCTNNPCVGTNRSDRLTGTGAKNEMNGRGGSDYVSGKQHADELYGGQGKDEVRAGTGSDRVFGGQGSDELGGGGGHDTISAQDGYKDDVNCGLGIDTAYVDKIDRVNKDCENVRRTGSAGSGNGANPEGTASGSGNDNTSSNVSTCESRRSGGTKGNNEQTAIVNQTD